MKKYAQDVESLKKKVGWQEEGTGSIAGAVGQQALCWERMVYAERVQIVNFKNRAESFNEVVQPAALGLMKCGMN